MNEILKEFQPASKSSKSKRESFTKTALQLLFFCILVTVFGIYIGNLLFGTNSLEVLLQLESKKEELSSHVQELQQQNATLQKEYFELKVLEPQ